MRDIERVQHQLYAKLPAFQRKLDWTRQCLEDALQKSTQWYLAFSGGVDSTVLLDLLYTQGYHVPVLFGDDGWDFPETLNFLAEAETRYSFSLRRIRCMEPWQDWCQEMGRPDLCDDPEALHAWHNPHQWDATWHSLKEASLHSYEGVFLGLLARESRARRLILHAGHRPLYQVASEHDMWHCSPLASWSKQDIWAYVIGRNVPYNPVYDRLAALGVPLEQRRVAPLTCYRVLHRGSAVTLKAGWPELHNALCAMFPMVRAFS